MFKKAVSVCLTIFMSLSFLMISTAAKKDKKSEEQNVPIQDKMDSLMASAKGWGDLSTDEKKQAVSLIMDLYKVRENAAMLKSSDFYVSKIDENLAKDPSMGDLGLPAIVKVLSVMEYDYYNGQNKEDLAQQVLGPTLYDENRKRRAREAGMAVF